MKKSVYSRVSNSELILNAVLLYNEHLVRASAFGRPKSDFFYELCTVCDELEARGLLAGTEKRRITGVE